MDITKLDDFEHRIRAAAIRAENELAASEFATTISSALFDSVWKLHYLRLAVQNIMNGIETRAITSDHDETFANAIKQVKDALNYGNPPK